LSESPSRSRGIRRGPGSIWLVVSGPIRAEAGARKAPVQGRRAAEVLREQPANNARPGRVCKIALGKVKHD